MALTKLTTVLNKISSLANTIRGQATTVKAAFDYDVNVVKDFINDTLIPEIEATFTTKTDITTNRKLSASGDFTGTWNGLTPVESDPGLQATVAGHATQIAKLETAGGTGTAITLESVSLADGALKNFIVSANNSGSATTINGKPLYKPNTTDAPTLTDGKAVTIWYSVDGDCFFIKASATGNLTADKALAGYTFSNDNDTDIIGTMALTADKLKAGTTLSGVTGTFTASATATADKILSGYTAGVNGNMITGTAVEGKKFASGTVVSNSVFANLTYANGTVYSSGGIFRMTVTGLSFKPSMIITTRWDGALLENIVYHEQGSPYAKSTLLAFGDGDEFNTNTRTFRGDVSPLSVVYGSFVLPCLYSNSTYTWKAWE